MKDRLMELLLKSEPLHERDLDDDLVEGEVEEIADHLLANGVIVLPCKIGDTVYIALGKEPKERQILYFTIEDNNCCFAMDDHDGGWLFGSFGKTVFLTREEAERALAERSNHEQRKAD